MTVCHKGGTFSLQFPKLTARWGQKGFLQSRPLLRMTLPVPGLPQEAPQGPGPGALGEGSVPSHASARKSQERPAALRATATAVSGEPIQPQLATPETDTAEGRVTAQGYSKCFPGFSPLRGICRERFSSGRKEDQRPI